jgi:hypothetical protein
MPADMPDLASQLRTIAESARTLRDAGVSGTVRVGDVEFTLDGPEPQRVASQQDEVSGNALDDLRTYGLSEGSQLPGLPRPQRT